MEATVSRPTGFTGFATTASAPPNITDVDEQQQQQQQQQPSSATVGPARATSKNKTLTEEDFVQTNQTTASVSEGRMPEIAVPEGDDSWRAYYEHPLTAATTAMLNINGAPEEQSSGIGLLYEYYKLPPMGKGDKLPPLKYSNIADIWSTQAAAASGPPGVDVAASAASGGSPCSVGGEEQQLNGGAPAENGDGQHETTAQDVVIYLNQSVASSPDAASVKREPEDLTSARRPELSGDAVEDEAKAGDDGAACCIVIVKQEPDDSPDAAALRSPPTPRSPQLTPDAAAKMAFPVQTFTMAAVAYDANGAAPQYSAQPTQFATATATAGGGGGGRQAAPSYAVSTDYYRDYVTAAAGAAAGGGNGADYYAAVRQQLSYGDGQDVAFVERYMRQGAGSANGGYKGAAGLTVDLPSPDSGIGEAAITPRDSAGLPQMFDYSELSQNQMVTADPNTVVSRGGTPNSTSSTRRPWHDFSRSSEAEKIQIPKIFSNVGFRYYLESPISTSQRREDDRITYINKGQFYGISLEYIPDPDKPLKSQTVKSVVLLVFREEKSSEDEMKAWQFWHSRQHSVKQRILDADTKNSTGLVGCIEEMTHNAIAVYWNPMEGPAKINVAVQCLSTDFSNQKGVKGLPLHLQIDTYEDGREPLPPVHRGYCQIKVFCDKGAERKTRDEERRAAKRKLTVTGRKKMDELYHPACDRSEFYAMSDLMKPPMLFSPTEDLDKITSMELNFYNSEESPTLSAEKKLAAEAILQDAPPEPVFTVPPLKKAKMSPPNDRVMLYIRQDDEEVYTPLHLVPPSLVGLANAIENKYKICASDLKHLYKRSKKGITVRMDDEMIRHYFNEDTFIISFSKLDDGYEVTLNEL